MEASLFLQADHSARFILPPETDEDKRRRREEQEERIIQARKVEAAAAAAPSYHMFGRRGDDFGVAAPSFDDAPPVASHVVGFCASPKRKRKAAASARRVDTSMHSDTHAGDEKPRVVAERSRIVEAENGPVPLPEKREMMVRYRAMQVTAPIAARSRLFREPPGFILNAASGPAPPKPRYRAVDPNTLPIRGPPGQHVRPSPRGPAAKSQTASAKANGNNGRRVSRNPEVFSSCVTTNPIPQTELVPELSASMQLARVAISHLRGVGALPYVLDVEYGADCLRLVVSPHTLHPSQFPSIPQSTVRLFPVVGRTRELSDRTRLLRFDPLESAKDTDIVMALAFDADSCAENPWEPLFFERDVRYRFYTGPSLSVNGGETANSLEIESHQAAMRVDSSRLVVGGDVTGECPLTSAVIFSRDAAVIQEAYGQFDACRDELCARHGFSRQFAWGTFASRLHTAIFVAVHRTWTVMQRRNAQVEAERSLMADSVLGRSRRILA